MIAITSLPELTHGETIELARMLLARKLMPEDRRGTVSPVVNAPLAQAVILQPDIPARLADWLPRLKQRFSDKLADTRADPSLDRHLREMQDQDARRNLITQYFLPFPMNSDFGTIAPESIADALRHQATAPAVIVDLGPLYPAIPQNGKIRLPLPFLGVVFDQILIGRHSHLHLETRRTDGTDAASSDAAIHKLMDAMAAHDATLARPPFHARQLSQRDFAQSFAYTQMMELGFSRQDMLEALAPWRLVD